MQKRLLGYLCCPKCKNDLFWQEQRLVCQRCKKEFPIKNGIPILINLEKAPKYLGQQIAYFEQEDKTRPTYHLEEWQKSYLKKFFANCKIDGKSLVIDIACGSGYMAVEIAKRGVCVIACDITLKQLYKLSEFAKKNHLEKNLWLVGCSAEQLPFKNKIADVVIENAILEHLPQEEVAIKEIERIAKKRATLMVSVPLSYQYLWPFLIPINLWFDRKIGHLRRYTKNSLINKFSRFKLKQIYYTGHLLKFILFSLVVFLKTKKLDQLIEKIDEKFVRICYGGTVIVAFFDR